MTIDEAIKHCEEVAEENEQMATYNLLCTESQENDCLECAKEHRQLAEWLRELKDLRKNRVGRVGAGCANCIHMKNKYYTKRPCGVCCNNYFSKFEEVKADE